MWSVGSLYPDIGNQADLCTLGEVTVRRMGTEKEKGPKEKEEGIEKGPTSRWQCCPAARPAELTAEERSRGEWVLGGVPAWDLKGLWTKNSLVLTQFGVPECLWCPEHRSPCLPSICVPPCEGCLLRLLACLLSGREGFGV